MLSDESEHVPVVYDDGNSEDYKKSINPQKASIPFSERNKMAAKRFRQKKKEEERMLRETIERQKEEIKHLKSENDRLQGELERVTNALFESLNKLPN